MRSKMCPICKSEAIKNLATASYSGWWGYKPKTNITNILYSVCENCSFKFQNPEINKDEVQRMYREGYFINQDDWFNGWKKKRKPSLNFYRNLIQNNSDFQILEVGCSNGFNLLNIKEEFSDVEVEGFEFDKKTIEYARKKGLSVSNTPLSDCKKKYDLVLISHVLEHVDNFYTFIHELTQLLKNDGKLIVFVPDAETSGEVPNWNHLNYFSKKSLENIFSSLDLKYIVAQGVTNKIDDISPELKAIVWKDHRLSIDYPSDIEVSPNADVAKSIRAAQRARYDLCLCREELKRIKATYKKYSKGRSFSELLLWSKLYRFFTFKSIKVMTEKEIEDGIQ